MVAKEAAEIGNRAMYYRLFSSVQRRKGLDAVLGMS